MRTASRVVATLLAATLHAFPASAAPKWELTSEGVVMEKKPPIPPAVTWRGANEKANANPSEPVSVTLKGDVSAPDAISVLDPEWRAWRDYPWLQKLPTDGATCTFQPAAGDAAKGGKAGDSGIKCSAFPGEGSFRFVLKNPDGSPVTGDGSILLQLGKNKTGTIRIEAVSCKFRARQPLPLVSGAVSLRIPANVNTQTGPS